MKLAEVQLKKNTELIEFAKVELKEKVPSDIDSMERPVLIEVVKDIIKKKEEEVAQAERATAGSPTAPVTENANKSVPDGIVSDIDALEALKIMGFESKTQVKAYLKGVEREKGEQIARLAAIEQAQKDLDDREGKLGKRERDIDAQAQKVLADLREVRQTRENNLKMLEKQ